MEKIHLETKNLSFTYPDGTQALKNVNIQIKKGEKIAIMGPNGAGKSTLFSHFNGLSEPTSGHVEVEELYFRTLMTNYSHLQLKKMWHSDL